MAKIRQPCPTCRGTGMVLRSTDPNDKISKDLLQSFPDKLCDQCHGNGFVISEVSITEVTK